MIKWLTNQFMYIKRPIYNGINHFVKMRFKYFVNI